jgi:hypothetical protein
MAADSADDPRSGDYIIDGSTDGMTGQGALLRVSAGPQRLVSRTNVNQKDAAGILSVGAADLEGNSLLLDSSGDLTASPDATLKAKLLALGAGKVTFTANGEGLPGLVITPALQALFSKAQQLTISTPSTIDFSSGTYAFNDLSLDTPGLLLRDGSSVVLKADVVDLANSGAAAAACGANGAAACGSGNLTIDAGEIDFGSGTVRTYGFGGSVTLSGSNGIFAQGSGSTFDAGPAALNLETPFLGDRATAIALGDTALIPSLSFLSTGDVAVSDPGGSAAGAIAGTPGASLSITGNSVSISGTTVRATAGLLDVASSTKISVADGAILETPGYSHNFGDSADPYVVSAPGGQLQLTALDGDIDLASGTTLSVGGGNGKAGTLQLQAQNGSVSFDGTIAANAPDGGGSFILDEKGAFDLTGFLTQFGGQFDGTIAVRTGTGDLGLTQGQTLKAANVMLVADGGLVDIAGTVDASGINGGDVSLYGLDGVTLESGSHIDAHANGYGLTDTRQAHGGNVTIGTDRTGTITVDNGAIIDVSARNSGDRLVPMTRNGTVYYTYVAGDIGGTVHFRAPVIQQPDGSDTVNVFYSGTIDGASSVVLEGFKRFDLAAIAADHNFVGVTIDDQGQAVLDVGAVAGAGQSNFLADDADGTLVQFVQGFDISAANGHLGSLASSAVFHEQPGMELDYSGNIVLSSNWNLGAGVVDVAGAVAAGLMAQLPTISGKYYVLPGMEGEVFQRFTNLTYRTGGSVDGEPGILTIRAGGTLDIEGSITDGFFQFHNQNDPDYLNMALGGGNKIYTPYLVTNCTGVCDNIGNWSTGDALPGSYVLIRIPGSDSMGAILDNPAPYSVAANAPAALGSLAGNSGDPLGSAELFPLLSNGDGSSRPVASWSYQLVGGADLTGSSAGTPSSDPLRILASAGGNLVIAGGQNYSYAASAAGASSAFGDGLLFNVGGQYVTPDAWYADFLSANSGVNANSYAFINFQSAPPGVVSFLLNAITTSLPADQYQLITFGKTVSGVAMPLKLASQFLTDVVAANFSTLKSDYKAPKPKIETKPTNGFTQTLVRTGTGNIELAAAGNIDMRNDPEVARDVYGNVATKGGLPVGGTAVYTAGHLVDPEPIMITDALTGLTATIDPTAFETSTDFLAQPPVSGYMYGAGGDPSLAGSGLADVFIANPVYAEGGGNISMTAGGSVLGRRDIWLEARLAAFYGNLNSSGYTWIGTADQPWRSGQIGDASNVGIDPQLFQEGVGALGGGNISITAGGDVSDLSVVDTTSLTSASVQLANTKPTLALWTFGGGNVGVHAAGNLLGGRLDVGSGTANVTVGGNIASAGLIQTDNAGDTQQNELRIRLSDAFVSLEARGGIDIQGITALGVGGRPDQADINLDSHGFYSAHAGVSLLADGAVTVENAGSDVLTENDYTTDLTASAVYPGTFEGVSLNGNLSLVTSPGSGASAVLLYPSPTGELVLAAGGNILPLTVAEDDGDPGLLPGVFSIFNADPASGVLSGRTFLFPGVLPNTPEVGREALHNSNPTHLGDPVPNRIYAGGNIENMIVSVAKQTRIGAGLDIVNMMFFGQNLSPSDVTRVVAGRDITATTELVEPVTSINPVIFGEPEAAVQGNTFVIGGPGSFFLEAGRDAGPFLNSAVTDGFATTAQNDAGTGTLTYGGGILSVGNDWNPWLPEAGASLFVEFGVGKGQNFDGFRNYYLDPANLANLDGSLFVQVTDANGISVPDRSQPIYAPILIKWLQNNAASELMTAYGTTNVDFQQAYDVFKTLPELQQRVFMLGSVYFNELIQTSIPTSPSYKKYSRGYLAVNTLFPASFGYTQNDLSGGGNGSNQPVETGNLDLRLATIQTDHGGNIYIVGPGGRVLAGSTVRTSDQAARRTYDGGILFAGNAALAPLPSTTAAIPIGYEGILTLRGGSINTFTDEDFLLNQSRLFTEDGGDIAMWSSNGDLNAGQGPKTSANFPPVIVRVDEDLHSQLDSVSGVSGAGIAAFQPAPGVAAPDIFLIAPRGTVDAGDAGVRVAGNLFIAALAVANAENFSVGGTSFGVPGSSAVNVAAQTSGNASAAAAEQAAQSLAASRPTQSAPSIISVDFLGVIDDEPTGDDERRKRKKQPQVSERAPVTPLLASRL